MTFFPVSQRTRSLVSLAVKVGLSCPPAVCEECFKLSSGALIWWFLSACVLQEDSGCVAREKEGRKGPFFRKQELSSCGRSAKQSKLQSPHWKSRDGVFPRSAGLYLLPAFRPHEEQQRGMEGQLALLPAIVPASLCSSEWKLIS